MPHNPAQFDEIQGNQWPGYCSALALPQLGSYYHIWNTRGSTSWWCCNSHVSEQEACNKQAECKTLQISLFGTFSNIRMKFRNIQLLRDNMKSRYASFSVGSVDFHWSEIRYVPPSRARNHCKAANITYISPECLYDVWRIKYFSNSTGSDSHTVTSFPVNK